MPSTSTGLTGATRQQIEYQAWLRRVTDPGRDWSTPTGAVRGVEDLAMESLRRVRRGAVMNAAPAAQAPGAPGDDRGERRRHELHAAAELSTRTLLLSLTDRAGRACAAIFRNGVNRLMPATRHTEDAAAGPGQYTSPVPRP